MKIWHKITLLFGVILFFPSVLPRMWLRGGLESWFAPPYIGLVSPVSYWLVLIGALFFLSRNQSVRNFGAGISLFGSVLTFLFFLSFFY